MPSVGWAKALWQGACSEYGGESVAMTSEGAMATYSVEVSGWDVEARFFVERAELCWDGDGDKFVSLQSPVCNGSLLSVRPILASGTIGPLLMAYQAELVAEHDGGEKKVVEIRLVPHRRTGSANSPGNRSLDSFAEFVLHEKQPA
jgi:hypothetical protein